MLVNEFKKYQSKTELTEYLGFEPFDIAQRSEWVYEKAMEDGIDLRDHELLKTIEDAPHPFQTGYLKSKAYLNILLAGSQSGKALDDGEDVYTPDGPKKMMDMKVGDVVLGPEGDHRNVLGVFPQGLRESYRITFDDGVEVVCDENHLWKFLRKKRRLAQSWSQGRIEPNPCGQEHEILTMKEIIDACGTGTIQETRRGSIPSVGRLDFKGFDLPLSPYIVGALFGYGSFDGRPGMITTHDDDGDIIDRIRSELPDGAWIKKHGNNRYVYSITGINGLMRETGLMEKTTEEKRIPRIYMNQPFDSRLALLQGLMDTDGTISKDRTSCEFYCKGRGLAEDVVWLVRSLGGKAKIVEKRASYRGKDGQRVDCGTHYRIKGKVWEACPFHLKRKANRWSNTEQTRDRIIHKIEPVGKRHTRCITIDHPDGLFVTTGFAVTHNSRAALIRALCILTGVFPYSLRYNEGEDTGVKRRITMMNVLRWGRQKDGIWLNTNPDDYVRFEDGSRIDRYNEDQLQNKADKEGWDCGNIIGVGKFPQELIAPEGSEVWIGTTQRSFQTMWKPNLFMRSGRPLLPETLLDKNRGNKGWSEREAVSYLVRNTALRTITYESGTDKFEAFKAVEIILDEEPDDEEFYGAAQERGRRISLVMTPYKGMTWTRPIIFGSSNRSLKRVFHCTQYDSPYCLNEEIESRRIGNPKYRRRSRVWGLHAEQEGEPFFNREKLDEWLRRLRPMYKLGIFESEDRWDTVKELMDTDVTLLDTEREDNRYAWRIYEKPVAGTPYLLVTDHAEGAEDHEEAGDWQTGIMFRPPKDKEKWPQPVAQIRSSLIVNDFADVCMMAAKYYNNASLCPESDKRGASNAYFHARVKDWKWFYSSSVEKHSVRKMKTIRGVDTNAATRDKFFKQIESWMEDFDKDDTPNYYDDLLLTELAQCVKSGKSGRADHKKRKSRKLDLAISFGIGLFVLVNYPDKVKCNKREVVQEKAKSFFQMIADRTEKKDKQPLARKVFR